MRTPKEPASFMGVAERKRIYPDAAYGGAAGRSGSGAGSVCKSVADQADGKIFFLK